MTIRPRLAQRLRATAPILAAALLLARPALAARLAFVINSNDASVSVLDVDTHRELRRIPVLREPHHMALTPDHRSLAIGDTNGNALFLLDPRTGDVQRQVTMSDPYQVEFSPDGTLLAVTGLARNQIDLYDAKSFALLHRIPASAMPSHINFSPDSSTVFVSLQQTDSVVAIATRTGAVIWKNKIGHVPAGVLWNNGELLVGLMGQGEIAAVDPGDGHVLRLVPTGRGAHVLFVSPDRSVIYATNRVDGTISVLDPKTLAVVRTLHVPGGPDDIDFAPDGKLWATLRWRQAVAVIDPVSGSVETIPVGRSPHGIWLNTHDTLPIAVSAK
jgi:YVTN family beta-propeller protein